ncbi:hypothetical protein AM466_11145 [Klebsiella pneumoniae]|nr:hypothetical protein AM466_11145 [Klebsiella pneumoniae]
MVCVVGRMRDLILQLSKSSIYSTKPCQSTLFHYSVLVIYLYALFNCGRSPIKNWRFFNAGILNIYDKMELFIKKGI